VKHENTPHIVAVEMITTWKLLKLVHIANLHIEPFCKLISKSDKKAVLIKQIVSNLFSCINMDFIIEGKGKCFGSD